MATSNSLNFSEVTGGNSLNPKYAKFSWTGTWDNNNRRWNISWNVTAQGGYNSTAYVQTQNGTITIAAATGTASGAGTKSMAGPIAQTHNDDIMLEGSFTLTPTNTGAASFTVSGSAQFWLISSFGTSTLSSTTQTLDTVSTASKVALNVSTKTIGSTSDANITVTVTSTGNYYHVLRYKTDNSASYVNLWSAQQVNNTSSTATITPTNILNKFPSAASGTLTVECLTYTNSSVNVQVGTTQTATCAITITTANFKPSVGLSAIAVNSYSTAGSGSITDTLVAGYSTAKSTPTVTAGTGTSISSIAYTITPGSFAKQTGTATSGTAFASSLLPASASNYTLTFAITATDARGATNTASKTATVYGYASPVITTNIYRVASSSSTSRDDAGTYVRINFSALVQASVNSKNSLQSTTCTATGTITGTQTNNTWKALATDKTATFTVTAKDKVSTVTTVVQIDAAKFALELYDDKAGTLWAQSGGCFRSLKGGAGDNAGVQVRNGTSNTDVAVSVKRTDTSRDVELLVGSGGTNRGLYSRYTGDWILYYNDTNLVFNKPVAAHTSGVITSSAGGSSWIKQRDVASIKNTGNTSGGSAWCVASIKTRTGNWAMCTVSTDEQLYFSYTTDTNYSNNSNSAVNVGLPTTGGVVYTTNNKPALTDLSGTLAVGHGGTGVTAAKGSTKQPVYLSSSGVAVCNAPASLYSGTLSSGSATLTNAFNYNYIIVMGIPGVSGWTTKTSITIPTALITTTASRWGIANESYGVAFTLTKSSNNITLTWAAGTGSITNVYGGI